jgi:hypothetical protein
LEAYEMRKNTTMILLTIATLFLVGLACAESTPEVREAGGGEAQSESTEAEEIVTSAPLDLLVPILLHPDQKLPLTR